MSTNKRHLPAGLRAAIAGVQGDRQGVGDKGLTRGAAPETVGGAAGGGIEESAIAEKPVVLTAKLLGAARNTFTGSELNVISCWCQCGGDFGRFMDLVNGNGRMMALLNTSKVRKAIEHLADCGECLGMVADSDEVAMRLSSLMRNRNIGGQMQLDSASNLARLKGMYPDKGTGGLNVQINFVGGLGD